MGSVSGSSATTFNGQSSFSSSFQQVLQRAVSIASLPMQEVQGEVTTLEGQQSDLNNMQSTFASLQSAIQAVDSATSGGVGATSSNTGVVSATAAAGTLPGTYSVEVSELGSAASAISGAGSPPVTDPTTGSISSSLNYTLTVNGTPQTLTLTSDTLDSLATAINDANAGASATIVNLGSNSSPDYRLAVTSTELGQDTIQLNDGTNDLLTSAQPGADTQYSVNGNSTVLTSSSDQITLAPGLTATLVSASPGNPVTITVAANENNLSSALSSFATAYNAAVTAVANERGQSGGALAGQSLVYTLGDTLSQIAEYSTGSGAVQDLSDLGLDLDSTGNLTFDSTQFSSLSSAGIQQYLGGLTSGGFLQMANNALDAVADPTSGAIVEQYNSIGSEITNDDTQISNDQTQVSTIQTNLQAQLSAADAAIAVLEQQQTFYSNLFATENANNTAGLG
jgi:flagellar hook-associated protein 2